MKCKILGNFVSEFKLLNNFQTVLMHYQSNIHLRLKMCIVRLIHNRIPVIGYYVQKNVWNNSN